MQIPDAAHEVLATFVPNPSLQQQDNLLELLFERMPMGIAILDQEFRIQRYNPTWKEFAAQYAPPAGAPLVPGVGYFDHLPGSEVVVRPLFKRALAGEIVQGNELRLESGPITTYWNIVLAPLTKGGNVIGILNVAVDVTDQVKLRQNLEQHVQERTQELHVLLDVASTANSSLNLQETLEKTLDLIISLVGASRSGVMLLDQETGNLSPYTLRPEQIIPSDELLPMLSVCQSVLATGQALYIAPNIDQGLIEPGALLPLQTRGNNLGVLVIIGPKGGEFSSARLALFQSIADQLSIAIENARLFQKNEQIAIAAERNRLARDLHDAVTQTLFSASMIAEVLPKIWQDDPAEGRHRLDELRQLTRGALSEMRTLLMELRPAVLADTDLGDLIRHQVNAFIARTRIEVVYECDCTTNPPLAVKEAFYRITQEAFNNITKHAEATQVMVSLHCQPGRAELRLQDNGIGFDLHEPNHEGLGLGIMQERAQNVAAHFEISSQPYQGVILSVVWQENGV